MKKVKFLFIFGTRPEAIKMLPLIQKFSHEDWAEIEVCNTGQHKEMTKQVCDLFEVVPNYELDIMRANQSLNDLLSNAIKPLSKIIEEAKPDWVLVQGDTSTAFIGALVAFYANIKVAHVEAGLRTGDKLAPFPEEVNRSLIGRIAHVHFAPTAESKNNLIKENINKEDILITGNTVIDALNIVLGKITNGEITIKREIKELINKNEGVVLITSHRRENFGEGMISICSAIKNMADRYPNFNFIFPVHPNPNVKHIVKKTLSNISNVFLIKPLDYVEFTYIMKHSKIIISDSGGVQEEAPSMGIPVLVLRDKTERPEAITAGTVKLVGVKTQDIESSFIELMEDGDAYATMNKATNPYGDGKASERIIEYFKNKCLVYENNNLGSGIS